MTHRRILAMGSCLNHLAAAMSFPRYAAPDSSTRVPICRVCAGRQQRWHRARA